MFLSRVSQLRQLVRVSRGICSTPVNGHWYDDYKPGPYPKTKEERDAAAKKYNLLPEEYEPYPDDGLGYGDYPKLPDRIGNGPKDPFYAWSYDVPNEQRNFGEPVHALTYGQSLHSPYTNTATFGALFGVIAGFFILFYAIDNYRISHPRLEKQYPSSGVVHYTFEPAE